jgi:hypothetical protein
VFADRIGREHLADSGAAELLEVVCQDGAGSNRSRFSPSAIEPLHF